MLFYDVNRAGRGAECELFLRDPAYQDTGLYRVSGLSEFSEGELCGTVQGCGCRNPHSCGTYRGDQEKGAQGNGSGYGMRLYSQQYPEYHRRQYRRTVP